MGRMHRAEERGAVQPWIVPHSDDSQLSAGCALCHSDDQRVRWLPVWNLHQQRGKDKEATLRFRNPDVSHISCVISENLNFSSPALLFILFAVVCGVFSTYRKNSACEELSGVPCWKAESTGPG